MSTLSIFQKRMLAVFCCMLLFTAAFASGDGRYTYLINKMSSLKSSEIIKQADAYERNKQHDKAMVLYMMVCNRQGEAKMEQEAALCAEANLKAGDIYFYQGNYAGALDFYVTGLKVCEASKQHKNIALFYKNIGNVYCVFQDYERGAEYFKKGYELCKKYPDINTERKLLINLTGLYVFLNKLPEARKYYRASMSFQDSKDSVNLFMNEFNLGMIQAGEGKYSKAVQCFKKLAADLIGSSMEPRYLCSAYQELYKTYSKIGNTDSTLYYLNLCEQTAIKHNIVHMFVEPLKDYSEVYEKLGNKAKAQEYKARFLTLSDSIFNVREFDMVKNVQFRYEMEKTNKEISDLHIKQEKREQTIRFQRIVMGVSFVAALLVTVFLIIVYRQKRRLDKSYTDLYNVNRNFIDNHEQMKKRHDEAKKRIAWQQEEIETLSTELGKAIMQQHDEEKKSDNGKYKSSNLNDMQRQALADSISDVMENSDVFCGMDFSLDRLAELVGSNSKYVSQVINDTFNKNFSSYVNDYRIRLACRRLLDFEHYGNYTTKAIGESLGYKSHASFINVFRKLTGLTPSQYQKLSKDSQGMDA